MYPRMDIRLDGVLANLAVVQQMAQAQGIAITAVTKALAGYWPLVEALVGAGAQSIGEAHLKTLLEFADLPGEKWMIRLPMRSQVDDVVHCADVSLNSDLGTIAALSQSAIDQGRRHQVLIMVEMGDRREGVMPEDLAVVCRSVAMLPGVELAGVATEFGCVSDVVPSPQAMAWFAQLVADTQSSLGLEFDLVSGGSSNGLGLLAAGAMPGVVNHLRVGEALLTGRVANFGTPLPGAALDPFTLSAEIIEIGDKPSLPCGKRAPGALPVVDDPAFPDRGRRRRALVAVGKQDVGIHHLTPHDPDIIVEEGASDVFVADITDCRVDYRVGDILDFGVDYFAILPSMVSSFVEKRLV
ncbi:MAG: alanine racemase [Propionibacteriaceae bacterium]|jgi:predicted amino acid racemase|nr:alanine racemase [Propionibacteriaceae bacterium]